MFLWVTFGRQPPCLEPLAHYLFQAITALLVTFLLVCLQVCVCYGSYCLSLTLPSCVQPLCIYCSFAEHLHKRQIINTQSVQSVYCVCSLWFREVYLSRWKMQPCLYFNLDLCAHPVVRLTSHACERVRICLRPHLDANGKRRRRDGDKGRWRWCLETERLDAAE